MLEVRRRSMAGTAGLAPVGSRMPPVHGIQFIIRTMTPKTKTPPLSLLYEQDETAWLEQTASLILQHRFDDIDHVHLSEYLNDMARRDKREVFSRLVTLLTHLLKWDHQPQLRSNSWRGTMIEQRRELRQLLESGTLRRYAKETLAMAYRDAIEQAAAETGISSANFPAANPWPLDELLAAEQG